MASGYDIRIGLQLPFALPASAPINRHLFPRTAAAVEGLATAGARFWRSYLMGAPMPSGRSISPRSGASARSVQVRELGDFSQEVYSDSPVVRYLEEGTRAYDMKRILQTSTKVRINKKGERYLIIPFRHGAPGAVGFRSVMPGFVHEQAKQLLASMVKSSGPSPNVIGFHSLRTRSLEMVTRSTYSWGGRLPAGLVARQAGHKTDRFAGMVRFNNPQGGHSQYLTFRVMREGSAGWIRPALPGYWAARAARDRLAPHAQQVLSAAFAEDWRAIAES